MNRSPAMAKKLGRSLAPPRSRPARARMLAGALLLAWPGVVNGADYAIGADLSFLRQAEQQGTVFKDGGEARPGLQIFKDHGYNWVRLRLFHSPTRLPNDLAYTVASALEARKLGFKFLLNYHYSDTWADPGKQILPKGFFDDEANALPVILVFDRWARR